MNSLDFSRKKFSLRKRMLKCKPLWTRSIWVIGIHAVSEFFWIFVPRFCFRAQIRFKVLFHKKFDGDDGFLQHSWNSCKQINSSDLALQTWHRVGMSNYFTLYNKQIIVVSHLNFRSANAKTKKFTGTAYDQFSIWTSSREKHFWCRVTQSLRENGSRSTKVNFSAGFVKLIKTYNSESSLFVKTPAKVSVVKLTPLSNNEFGCGERIAGEFIDQQLESLLALIHPLEYFHFLIWFV